MDVASMNEISIPGKQCNFIRNMVMFISSCNIQHSDGSYYFRHSLITTAIGATVADMEKKVENGRVNLELDGDVLGFTCSHFTPR